MTVETLDLRVGKGFELMKPSSVQVPMIPHLLEWSLLPASLVAQTVKNLPAMLETWVRSLGREDPPGAGNGNPLQYPCLETLMDRGAWWAAVHGVAKSQAQLSG